jgi:multicomponent Na+:H+ antiporter subunit B
MDVIGFVTLQEAVQLYPLLIFMILAAIVAVEIKDLLSSVIAVGAAGLALSVAFLILKAPDLAITQLVVEILCLILLIRATLRKDIPSLNKGTDYLRLVSALLFIAIFAYFASFAISWLPTFGNPIMRVSQEYINNGLRQTGAANLVASVILNYRGYDTLGEATVLFTAVMGVIVVLREIGRKK